MTQNLVGVTEFWAKVSNESGSYEGRAGDGSLKLQVQKADFGSTQNLGNDFYAVIRNEGGTVVDYAVSKNSNVEGWSSNGGKIRSGDFSVRQMEAIRLYQNMMKERLWM